MFKLSMLICCVFVVTGCVADLEDPAAESDELSTVEQPVYGGSTDTEHSAVVSVGGCTGTFFTPNHIVIAQHCLPACNQFVGVPFGEVFACYDGGAGPPWHKNSRSGFVMTRTARDGERAGAGTAYPIDFAWVPDGSNFPSGSPDVAILRTTRAFTGDLIPLMGPTNLPNPTNVSSYASSDVTIVGFSPNAGHNDARRRQADAVITGVSSDGHNRSFVVDGSSDSITACPGDSGGPVLVDNDYGNPEVAGVVSLVVNCNPGTTTTAPTRFTTDYAYIPRDFVDNVMCGEGWQYLGSDGDNAAAASSSDLIRLGNDGAVCRLDSTAGSARVVVIRDNARHEIAEYDSSVESWRLIDNNPGSVEIAVTATDVYQRHANGYVWQWNGGLRNWTQIDFDLDPGRSLTADSYLLYQLESSGSIWVDGAVSWSSLGHNSEVTQLETGGFGLFKAHQSDGTLWIYSGNSSWQHIDTDPALVDISVGLTQAAMLYSSGDIWAYDGGWRKLDDNRYSDSVVARGVDVFQMHSTGPNAGNVFRYDGSFRRWANLGGQSHGASAIFGNVGTLSAP